MTDANPTDTTPGTPDTVAEAVALLAAAGYTGEVRLRGATLRCGSCGTEHGRGPDHEALTGAVVERVHRFEGASDPDDEAIVLGIRCASCDERATLVSGYGPSADPDEIDLIVSLVDGR